MLGFHPERGPGHRRQPGHCLILEKLSGRELNPLLVRSDDDLNAEDGIAAQLEEVVEDADALQPQHLRPDRGQLLFRLGTRGDESLLQFGPRLSGCGQRAAIHLPVGR